MMIQSEKKRVEKQPDMLPVPRWIRIPQAVKYSQLSRAFVYRLISAGKIKSISIKSEGKEKGVRLVDRESIEAYFESLAKESN